MAFSLEIIHAFCGELEGRKLRGNPAAVVLLDEEKSDFWLQNVAAEMNLSETAFLKRASENWDLRWFTPQVEMDLCGHATLAAAHFLWSNGLSQAPKIEFSTRSGVLTARRPSDEIELDFPTQTFRNALAPAALLAALGVAPGVPVATFRAGQDWLLSFPRGHIESLKPDFSRLKAACEVLPSRGVIVTEKAPANANYDFASRFFAPVIGIDEDPVTGSAHTVLAPFWARILKKDAMTGLQCSARGGSVGVRLAQNRVFLRGRAHSVLRGHWLD